MTFDRLRWNSVRRSSTSSTALIDALPVRRAFSASTSALRLLRCGPTTRKAPSPKQRGQLSRKSGDVLLSQGDAPQVPSALAGLTAVFGMGTGVAPPPWSPEIMLRVDRDPSASAGETSGPPTSGPAAV